MRYHGLSDRVNGSGTVEGCGGALPREAHCSAKHPMICQSHQLVARPEDLPDSDMQLTAYVVVVRGSVDLRWQVFARSLPQGDKASTSPEMLQGSKDSADQGVF